MRYVGDCWEVDPDEFWVERDGERIELEPQAFDVLAFMLAHRDVLLAKADLFEGVWGDQFVSESALTTRIKQVRQALGDDGKTQRLIQTVHGRGYRFVGVVDEVDTAISNRSDTTAPPDTNRHNIPPARTRVIGRSALVERTASIVQHERLSSLLGLGGVGKTTVAREVGRRASGSFADGAWFVDLVPIHDTEELCSAIATAVGLRLRDGTAEELVDKLGPLQLLLILDNCEHIADTVGTLVEAILDRTEQAAVLATSRIPLDIRGEHRIPVPPLPISDPDGSAVELLHEIADRRGAPVDGYDQVAAINLCRRLDGLPLALELVGANLGTMTVFDVLKRVDRLVERTSTDGHNERQASLATILDDSFDALSPAEFGLLAALARVEGVIEFDDIERLAVQCGIDDAVSAVDTLASRSLLVPADWPGNHRVLETVRERARVRDENEERSQALHAEWCLDVVGRDWTRHFIDMEMARWAEIRYGDLVVAERFLRTHGRVADAAHLLAACGLAMHFDAGVRSGRWLELMGPHLERTTDPELQARLRSTGVMAAMSSRRHQEMYEHGQAAVVAADQTDDGALSALARVMRSWAGVVIDIDGALQDVDDAVELARSAGSEQIALLATGFKTFHLAMAARFDEAIELGRTAFDGGFTETTYPVRVVTLGLVVCLIIEDPVHALEIDAEVRARLNTLGMWGMDVVRACLHASSGAIDLADALIGKILKQLEREGVDPLPDLLLVPAVLALTRGESDRAARYLGAIRHADSSTQNLLASTTYRVVRSHVDPAPAVEVAGRVDEIWAEAQAWLAGLTAQTDAT